VEIVAREEEGEGDGMDVESGSGSEGQGGGDWVDDVGVQMGGDEKGEQGPTTEPENVHLLVETNGSENEADKIT
jgi:hypothetical protein